MQARKFVYVSIAVACLIHVRGLAGAAEKKAAAKPKPDATLSLTAKQVSAGVGYSWGAGKLTYKGKTYPVVVDGLTVGSAGVSSISAKGSVSHLAKLEDFEGNYTAAVAGATVGGGAGGLVMQNQNGVEVSLHATTRGVSLTAGVSGVKLSIKK
jgi:hypothetical protein